MPIEAQVKELADAMWQLLDDMDWITIGGVALIAAYIGLHVYAWTHQDNPFWRGFVNPFGFR